MKVVSAHLMADLEAQAYAQGYTDSNFMEKAGEGISKKAEAFASKIKKDPSFLLLCGKGNNGGDAFVAGCYLLEKGFSVSAIQLQDSHAGSDLCKKQEMRFIKAGGTVLRQTPSPFPKADVIIDGLFGTGFKGSLKEPYASLVEKANSSRIPILAVDIPSGLDGTTGMAEDTVIRARETIFLGLPKTGFFLNAGWNHVGILQGVDFGLPAAIIQKAEAPFELITLEKAASLIPSIPRSWQKYQRGYAIGIAGSPGMPGAALLSSLAALRGGAGIVRLCHPEGMETELAYSPYELIKVPFKWNEAEKIALLMEKAGAYFMGPGLGRSLEAGKFLAELLPALKKPCVIDADALNLLSEDAFLLPSQAILTPHTGEMARLLKSKDPLQINDDLLKTCQSYAEKNKITLILKGAPTFIFHPGKAILVNPTGDPGMAAAGSGDVLTGLLAALLSRGLDCHEAAILGVYLHGLAGQLAVLETTSHTMMASDLIKHFPAAYQKLESVKETVL